MERIITKPFVSSVLFLASKGYAKTRIARELGVSKETVYRAVQKAEFYGLETGKQEKRAGER